MRAEEDIAGSRYQVTTSEYIANWEDLMCIIMIYYVD
jgi:hypothetical protein